MPKPDSTHHVAVISDLLTADEVGQFLRLPLSTVYYLAKAGRIPAVRFGRSWRFPRAGIEGLKQSIAALPVLVVDDDAVTRTMVAAGLSPYGYRVWEAASAEEGLQICRRHRFCLFFIDLMLPGRSGTDLIRELLGEYSLRQMVVITAYPKSEGIAELLEIGPITLLRKPLALAQIVECAHRVAPNPSMASAVNQPEGSGRMRSVDASVRGSVPSTAEPHPLL